MSFSFIQPVYAVASGCATIGAPGAAQDVQSLGCLADTVVSIINVGFGLLGALILLYLLFGAIKFVTSRGDQKAVQSAKGTMTYAIIAGVLILGAYIIINFFTRTFGLPDILNNFSFTVNP